MHSAMKRRTPKNRRHRGVHDWAAWRDAERPVARFSHHAPYRLGLAYANTYEVGMSSLGFQRVYELVHQIPEWTCERFFTDGAGMPRSVETDTPLAADALKKAARGQPIASVLREYAGRWRRRSFRPFRESCAGTSCAWGRAL